MKKIALILTILFVGIILVAPIGSTSSAYADETTPIISMVATDLGNDEIEVAVTLSKNSGILSMQLELEYDREAMQLTGYQKGEALSGLELVATNHETELGYAIYPFCFIYDGVENDYTNGLILTLRFKINQSASNGDYEIALTYTRNQDIIAISEESLVSKNVIISAAQFTVSGHDEIVEPSPATPSPKLVVVIVIASVLAVLAIAGIVLLVYKKKR